MVQDKLNWLGANRGESSTGKKSWLIPQIPPLDRTNAMETSKNSIPTARRQGAGDVVSLFLVVKDNTEKAHGPRFLTLSKHKSASSPSSDSV